MSVRHEVYAKAVTNLVLRRLSDATDEEEIVYWARQAGEASQYGGLDRDESLRLVLNAAHGPRTGFDRTKRADIARQAFFAGARDAGGPPWAR